MGDETKPTADTHGLPGEAMRGDRAPDAGEPSFVVGVGASAGGLEAFEHLLEGLPSDTGMAFVIVQHLAPNHESRLDELLARFTAMPVLEVEDGMRLAPDTVFVIPPNTALEVSDGALVLSPRPEGPARHMAVDIFFRSLAGAFRTRAIGVILSGTGSDGALGVHDVKAGDGMTFAQEPESAKFDAMPRNAIATGDVDYVLEPADVGQRLVDVGPLRTIASTGDGSADATGGRATAATHIAFERHDGRRVDVEVSTSAYEAGPTPLVIYNLRDVTERRRVEESERRLAREQAARAEAERANRMKDLFLGTLSHELRTPLNASLGWTQLLRGGRLDAATVTRGLDAIERNTRHQARLIDDLLDVSRIVAGKLALEVRPVDLATVVESAAEEIRAGASARSIDIHVEVGSEAVLVGGDANRLQQVVTNLLANAVKFSKPGQSVSMRLERDTRYARIVVTDQGAGIAPDFLPVVFERFRQGDESFARTHGGLGIGLAIVRHIVERHGGTVRAESAGVDAGATFVVTLPVLSEAAPGLVSDASLRAIVGSPALPPTSCLSGLRVVLVEDEEDARTLFALVLEREGARVAAAGSAAEAIAHFEREVPDVLVSDIGLPEVDGLELLARVRALGPGYGGDVPAVALTAYASAADVAQALEAGYQTHLSKPVELAKLVQTIAELAGRARPEPFN